MNPAISAPLSGVISRPQKLRQSGEEPLSGAEGLSRHTLQKEACAGAGRTQWAASTDLREGAGASHPPHRATACEYPIPHMPPRGRGNSPFPPRGCRTGGHCEEPLGSFLGPHGAPSGVCLLRRSASNHREKMNPQVPPALLTEPQTRNSHRPVSRRLDEQIAAHPHSRRPL